MSSMRVAAAAICVAIGLLAGVWKAASAYARDNRATLYSIEQMLDTGATDEVGAAGVKGTTRLDRYGNEVDEALGDYRFDPRGEMYELHSPDTAMPQLGRPST